MSAAACSVIRWSELPPTLSAGETGAATQRTADVGGVRSRLVEFSVHYRADHWCTRGHIVFVLEGSLVTELADGRRFEAPAGTGIHIGGGEPAHRPSTVSGAVVFIVDRGAEHPNTGGRT